MAGIGFEPSEFMLRRALVEENKARAAAGLSPRTWADFLAELEQDEPGRDEAPPPKRRG